MNILIIISSLSFGGAEKQAIQDANMLAEKHKVILYYFKNGPLKKSITKNVQSELINKRGYLLTAFCLRKRNLSNKIEVIHASLFAPIVISSLASIFTRTKIFWHFHSHENDLPLKSRLTIYWLAKLRNVIKILFVSNELLNHFSSYKFPKTKTGVFYNHSEISGKLHIKEYDSKSLIHIGYVGRVIDLKRVNYLVDLAENFINNKLNNFIFHIVGDGDNLGRIKKLVIEKNLSDYFKFHGFQNDVITYYKKFDFFINPSSEECLSMAMIDAGMTALPVVAFDVGGNNEIVLNGITGFIVKRKDEFFEKCLLLAKNSEIRMRFGMEAYQHCNSMFNKKEHLNSIERIYKELLGTY